MSGIVGFISKQVNIDSLYVLKRMLTRIKHRGPDYNGVFVSRNIGLGNAMILLNQQEDFQLPFSNADKTSSIAWSGRIFNRLELSSKLLEKGCSLKTNSDAELCLQLYEQFGANCLSMINGQFAFSIWNSIKEEMFLARDRVGICPLYYSNTKNGFVFASEIKSILEYPEFYPRLSAKSLSQIITFWTNITPNTIFEEVYELSPGHYLTIGEDRFEAAEYWSFPFFKADGYSSLSLPESIEQLRDILDDSVQKRVDPEDSYAAYLSGGLDSSVTTSFIKNKYPNLNLDTFSISFKNKAFDESFYQKVAADYFKTNHSKIICSDEDIVNNFQSAVWHAETPMLRTAPVPMLLLSGLAKRSNVKMVLSGEGADEILGGYNIFKEAIIREFWSKEPSSKYRPLLLKKLYPYLTQMGNANNMALKMFFGYKLTETSSAVYSHLLRWRNTSRIKNILSPDYQNVVANYDPIEEVTEKLKSKLNGIDLISRAQYIEATIFMSGYLISTQGERMAMANSVEGRYPFLDHRVIEICMKLRPRYKLNGLNEKYILKEMMKNRLPEEIFNRPKQPYRAPVSTSFLSESAHSYVDEFISDKSILSTGIFDENKVNQLISRMKNNNNVTEIDNMALTAILSTQMLNSLFIEKKNLRLTESDLIKLDNIVYDNVLISHK